MVEQKLCFEISPLCTPWPKGFPSTNVCDLISCPLQAGNHYQITEKIAIPDVLPNVSDILQLYTATLGAYSSMIL